jgi:hypothetical protein
MYTRAHWRASPVEWVLGGFLGISNNVNVKPQVVREGQRTTQPGAGFGHGVTPCECLAQAGSSCRGVLIAASCQIYGHSGYRLCLRVSVQ